MVNNLAKITMKKLFVLLSVVSLVAVSFAFSSCKKSDSSSNGEVMFWMDASSQYVVTVEFRNHSKDITYYYHSTPSDCGANGCATFNDVPAGTYSYYAESHDNVHYWEGRVTVHKDQCFKMRLYIGKALMKENIGNNMDMLEAEPADEYED